MPSCLVGNVNEPDLSNSRADSASSILVTRSSVKAQVRTIVPEPRVLLLHLKSRTAVRRELVTGAPQIMNVTTAQLGAVAGGLLRKQMTG